MTVLVLGGTGMLAPAVRRLLADGTTVVSASRRPERLEAHPFLTGIRADWSNAEGLAGEVAPHGSFDSAVLWVHLEHRPTVYRAVSPLLADDAVVVEVSGSGGRVPEARELATTLLAGRARTLRRVLLGSMPHGFGRRWLTDEKISAGALAALHGGPAEQVVGEL